MQASDRGEARDMGTSDMTSPNDPFKENDPFKDLTFGQLKAYKALSNALHDSAIVHGLTMLVEGEDHTCEHNDEAFDLMPEMNDDDLRAFFAYESAALTNFATMREVMDRRGLPVETRET